MRIVREHIYERFSEKSDPVKDMGIGQRHLIIKWFKSINANRRFSVEYKIDDNLNITIMSGLNLVHNHMPNLTYIPDNLNIYGFLDLEGSKITKLPKNLYVDDWLDISGSNITKLPDDIRIHTSIYADNSKLSKLPDNLKIKWDLDLRNCKNLTKLPENLTVGANLDISGTSITHLPKNLTVKGNLNITNTKIKYLPKDLKVHNKILRTSSDRIVVGYENNFITEKFIEDSDPIKDMNIGIKHSVSKWLINQGFSYPNNYIKIKDDGVIDVDMKLRFNDIQNFPEYIKFGSINGDFIIENSQKFTSLKGLPKKVYGDFIFVNNGIKPTEKEIRKICDVEGHVMFVSKSEFINKLRKEKYKKLGPVKDRPSPNVNYGERHVEQTYSRGYMLWKLLEFIESKKSSGAKYSEIVKFYYGTFMGQSYRRTPSSGVYNSLRKYTDRILRINTGRYFLNYYGEEYLKKYKGAFDKK